YRPPDGQPADPTGSVVVHASLPRLDRQSVRSDLDLDPLGVAPLLVEQPPQDRHHHDEDNDDQVKHVAVQGIYAFAPDFLRAAWTAMALPKAWNSARFIGFLCGSYSACHCTPRAKPGASAIRIASMVPSSA